MNLEEVLNYRRSVRVFDKTKPLDPEKVKHCLELATLAPNSSNMQLWEFYQVIQPELLAKISKACLDQTATSTASEVVVFVTRQELYYGKLMPFLYARFFRILGLLRSVLAKAIGLFRPIVREVSESDMRVVVHKSCALAAQTFMIAMANEGYDTCPLEGFDSKQMKKLLKLPHGAEVNMVIACGIRDGNKGIWGERGRVPFDEVNVVCIHLGHNTKCKLPRR